MQKNALDSELSQWLEQYNEFIDDENYPSAINIYNQIVGIYKTQEYLYVHGINYIKYSNFMASRIRYDRSGFMEENSAYKKASNEIYYNARLFLYKSINLVNLNTNSEEIPDVIYVKLLAQIKLGDMRGANDSIERIAFLNNKYLTNYSNILFYDASGEVNKTINAINAMIDEYNDYPITIFYYLAKSLYKKREWKNANEVIKLLSKLVYNKSIEHLSKNIENMLKA
ncbi:MAG: hypothetical protein M1385_02065 [Candidatus Marsarchaeota archaeon]|nr:hypothetical protein [Candidatus Marsarchaeota archaeon]